MRKNLAGFVAVFTCGAILLGVCWSQADLLASWAQEPNLLWGCAGILPLIAAAVLVVRSYPQVRQARLYGLVLLLLPWGLLQPLYFANVSEREATRPQVTTIRVEREGELGPPPSPSPAARRFLGVPDSLAKERPELPRQLRRGSQLLFGLGYGWLALAILLATPLARLQARRNVRLGVWALLGVQASLAALAWSKGLDAQSLPGFAYPLLYALAGGVALLTWRTPAGLGGALCGLLLVSLPAALAHAGVNPDQLGVPLKPLPHGVERAFAIGFPWLLLWVVGREWVVSMSHTTQHDALTQIFNKAYAETIVNRTGETDLGRHYSVAILDIDFFKKVNDTYGHSAGDDVLQQVAKTISDAIANRGLVCRTGGEEITVFFPGVEAERASEVCEEVRLAVEELEVPTRDNEGDSVTLSVTISVGVATNLDEAGTLVHDRVQDVVSCADRALYAAKEAGRNRIVIDAG